MYNTSIAASALPIYMHYAPTPIFAWYIAPSSSFSSVGELSFLRSKKYFGGSVGMRGDIETMSVKVFFQHGPLLLFKGLSH